MSMEPSRQQNFIAVFMAEYAKIRGINSLDDLPENDFRNLLTSMGMGYLLPGGAVLAPYPIQYPGVSPSASIISSTSPMASSSISSSSLYSPSLIPSNIYTGYPPGSPAPPNSNGSLHQSSPSNPTSTNGSLVASSVIGSKGAIGLSTSAPAVPQTSDESYAYYRNMINRYSVPPAPHTMTNSSIMTTNSNQVSLPPAPAVGSPYIHTASNVGSSIRTTAPYSQPTGSVIGSQLWSSHGPAHPPPPGMIVSSQIQLAEQHRKFLDSNNPMSSSLLSYPGQNHHNGHYINGSYPPPPPIAQGVPLQPQHLQPPLSSSPGSRGSYPPASVVRSNSPVVPPIPVSPVRRSPSPQPPARIPAEGPVFASDIVEPVLPSKPIDTFDWDAIPRDKSAAPKEKERAASAPSSPAIPHSDDDDKLPPLNNLSVNPSPVGSSSTSEVPSAPPVDGDNEDKNMCKICFEREIDTVILDCAHAVICYHCGSTLNLADCPICRAPVKSVLKIYKC